MILNTCNDYLENFDIKYSIIINIKKLIFFIN